MAKAIASAIERHGGGIAAGSLPWDGSVYAHKWARHEMALRGERCTMEGHLGADGDRLNVREEDQTVLATLSAVAAGLYPAKGRG